jgi:hypothetical protein
MERFHSTLAASTLVIVGYLSTVHSLHHIFTTAEMWVIDRCVESWKRATL